MEKVKYPCLETKRLLLKTTTLEHAPFILKIMNTAEWLEYIGNRNLETIDDARNYIATKMIPQLEKYGHSNFVIIEKGSESPIGLCGIYIRNEEDTPDLGYALLKEFTGKGYAFEACTALMSFAFNDLKLSELLAITRENNHTSRKLLERLNFQCQGPHLLNDLDKTWLRYYTNK